MPDPAADARGPAAVPMRGSTAAASATGINSPGDSVRVEWIPSARRRELVAPPLAWRWGQVSERFGSWLAFILLVACVGLAILDLYLLLVGAA